MHVCVLFCQVAIDQLLHVYKFVDHYWMADEVYLRIVREIFKKKKSR